MKLYLTEINKDDLAGGSLYSSKVPFFSDSAKFTVEYTAIEITSLPEKKP